MVRQVAYATQSRHDRKARHVAAAAYLAALDDPAGDLAQVVAKHLLDAIDAAPDADDVPAMADRARDHLERAAGRARALGAPTEAQVLLETALERTDDPATMARLHLSAASAAVVAAHRMACSTPDRPSSCSSRSATASAPGTQWPRRPGCSGSRARTRRRSSWH